MGYANVIPSKGDSVYGLLYAITQSDLDQLDKYEGVPYAYTRQLEDILVCKDSKGLRMRKEYDAEKRVLHSTIVYVDKQRMTENPPKTEYIYRMNQAIADAVEEGVPQDYIDKYLRKFIPQVPLSN
jgi:gamma-glutamylcyclotransferase